MKVNSLSVHSEKLRKSDLKRCRDVNSFKPIPESHFNDICKLGRCKYRAIVVSTIMSLLWDGWKPKKGSKRIPNNKVMLTRRMLCQYFGISESTAGQAISDLVRYEIITVATKSVFSGIQGKNLGASYRLPWMEDRKGKKIYIYWGLLVSTVFLELSVTLQAVIILLHCLHSRRKNRLTIQPYALVEYGIHRNRLTEYIDQLRCAGLLEYVENHDYKFTWFDRDGYPNFNRLKI